MCEYVCVNIYICVCVCIYMLIGSISCVSDGSDGSSQPPLFQGKVLGNHYSGNAIDIAVATNHTGDKRFSFLSFGYDSSSSEPSSDKEISDAEVEVTREPVFEISSDGTIQSSGGATFGTG